MMSHGYSNMTPILNNKATIGNKLISPTEVSMNVMVLGTENAVFFDNEVIMHYKYLLVWQMVNQDF
jgi:hypothetical protein